MKRSILVLAGLLSGTLNLSAQRDNFTIEITGSMSGEKITANLVSLELSENLNYICIVLSKNWVNGDREFVLTFLNTDGSPFGLRLVNDQKNIIRSSNTENDLAVIPIAILREQLIANNITVNFASVSEANIYDIIPGIKPEHIAEIKLLVKRRLGH